MNPEEITSRKEKIAVKKASLERKEKMINELERKFRTKKLIEFGSLISKAGIDNLEFEALYGALLDIKEKSIDEPVIKTWIEKGSHALNHEKVNQSQRLIISFSSEPSAEAKDLLKKMRFKWNIFRREWYGIGKKEQLVQLFNNAKIEIVEG